MSSDPPAQVPADLSSQDWLKQMLPLIRVRKYRPLTFFPAMHEVVGLYPLELVVIRKRKNIAIPESAYGTDGAELLKEIGKRFGRVTSVALDEITHLVSTPRSVLRECDTLKAITAKKTKLSFRIKQQDTPNFYRALGLMLGTRYQQRNWIPLTGLWWALSFVAMFLSFVFFPRQVSHLLSRLGLPFDVGNQIALIVVWGAVAAGALILTIANTIPGRIKTRFKKKTTPLKDLSGRQPIHLHIAGRMLTIVGSLLVMYSLGGGLMDVGSSMKPGG